MKQHFLFIYLFGHTCDARDTCGSGLRNAPGGDFERIDVIQVYSMFSLQDYNKYKRLVIIFEVNCMGKISALFVICLKIKIEGQMNKQDDASLVFS